MNDQQPTRREFLGTIGLTAFSALPAVAGPFEGADFEKLVPADKKLRPEWLRSLVERGQPTTYRGAELDTIGMPVGGLCAGQLYLGGDGRLWHWDIFNTPQPAHFGDPSGPDYARPPKPSAPVEQGFALKVTAGGKSEVRTLDRHGFKDVSFIGQYPIGHVSYRDPDSPVSVTMEGFSPFIPLDLADSSLPATILHFTLKNRSDAAVEVELVGWLENAVCLQSGKTGGGRRRNRLVREPGLMYLHYTAEPLPEEQPSKSRPDIVFEDFEKETYEGWKVEGTAFGRGPVKRSDVPPYMGEVGGKGQRVVNSHAAALGKDVAERDAQTGKLTSRTFRIERRYFHFFIGGGDHPGKTCLNLAVDGEIVRTATGHNDNHMREESFDLHDLEGKQGTIEIVDAWSVGWGNIGVDHLVFSDTPRASATLDRQVDFGSLALALLGETPGDFGLPALSLDGSAAHALFPPERRQPPAEVTEAFGRRFGGALGRRWSLKPGAEVEVVFVITWYFPALPRGRFARLKDAAQLRRSYSYGIDSAADLAGYVARNFERLAGQTRRWKETWYDSTLPHWFLDRTFLTLCCLATATAYHFTNGRFYAMEGTYCCDGTCTHVWHYAQGMARIFPELEQATRTLVDYGIAFHEDTGAMDYRAEYDRRVAHDGQAGTILRVYREHQMAADDGFLKQLWPKVKKSIVYLMRQDPNKEGILEGEQYNTLDASWYGEIPWISSLYLACLRAGAAMAREVGDEPFARQCEAIADRGARKLVERLYNGEYFIQLLDPKHPEAINTNDGCHIDQVFGQGWAFQVGLPRVLPAGPVRSALEALWKYNFTPDVGPYRQQFRAIPGGRWYAMPGEGGLLMCTWPKGGAEKAHGKGEPGFVAYFNECMTGFEYQVAAHLIWERMTEKGLAVTRMIHDRYHAARRNPWNEVECSDHYARSMASYGVFLAACGFEYHGPRGHLGFAPRVSPEKFKAAFTAAEGWGALEQVRDGHALHAAITVRWGRLRLRSLAFELAPDAKPTRVSVRLGESAVEATQRVEGARCVVTLGKEVVIAEQGKLTVVIE